VIDSRAGRTPDARVRVGQARDLIGRSLDPGILVGLLAETEHQAGPPAPAAPPRGRARRPDRLTDRQAEVLRLLSKGYTNLEIAARLQISVHTVERHLQNAYPKVGVRNRADAAACMARDGGRHRGRSALRPLHTAAADRK
jgi:DNA-binding NarL/FixJ family response regulator